MPDRFFVITGVDGSGKTPTVEITCYSGERTKSETFSAGQEIYEKATGFMFHRVWPTVYRGCVVGLECLSEKPEVCYNGNRLKQEQDV
jgi:hypothetical protein